jgi:hypothetical protein
MKRNSHPIREPLKTKEKKTIQFRTPQDKNISAPDMNYSLSYEIMFPQQKDQCGMSLPS